jgi:hypothetical protein
MGQTIGSLISAREKAAVGNLRSACPESLPTGLRHKLPHNFSCSPLTHMPVKIVSRHLDGTPDAIKAVQANNDASTS